MSKTVDNAVHVIYNGRDMGPVGPIKESPYEDLVPVVRCKDCVWSHQMDAREPKFECLNISHFGCAQWFASDDFCSYGEREEDE